MQRQVRQLLFGVGVTWVAGLLAGCSVTHGDSLQPPETAAAPETRADGLVRIADQSVQYLSLEQVEPQKDRLAIRVPARMEFRDGAVSEVGAPMAGRVGSVLVKTGDRVKTGDPLVFVSCPDAASARTSLATAQAALREAKAALDRETRMLEEGVGIERDKLAAEIRLESAQAELDRARATSSFIGAGEGAEVALRTPIGGVVLSVKASRGAAVGPGGEALVEVGDPTALWVVADVPERELSLVTEGSAASVELSSVAGPLRARVISIGSVVSSGLRTAPVRIALDAPRSDLRPGMFGRVRIETSGGGPTLPVEAVLIRDGKESVVYVARDDVTFERRPVVVSRPVDGRVQVISGLSTGERVVVRGALLLDGSAEQLL